MLTLINLKRTQQFTAFINMPEARYITVRYSFNYVLQMGLMGRQ